MYNSAFLRCVKAITSEGSQNFSDEEGDGKLLIFLYYRKTIKIL